MNNSVWFLLGYFGFNFVWNMLPAVVAFMLKKVWRWYIFAIGLVLFAKAVLEQFGLLPWISLFGYEPDWKLLDPGLWFLALALSVLGKSEK